MSRLNADFLTREQLEELGFKALGKEVLLHSTAIVTNAANVSIGDHVRIDPFVILSAATIEIGRNVHIAAGATFSGRETVSLQDFVGISQGTRVFSSNDSYDGRALTGPTVPTAFTSVVHAPVTFGRHVVIGAGSIVLPGVTVGEGSIVGALSLVSRSLKPWGMYGGVPAKLLRPRSQALLRHEAEYLSGSSPTHHTEQ